MRIQVSYRQEYADYLRVYRRCLALAGFKSRSRGARNPSCRYSILVRVDCTRNMWLVAQLEHSR